MSDSIFEEYIRYLWEEGFLDDFQYSQENLFEVKMYKHLTEYFKENTNEC